MFNVALNFDRDKIAKTSIITNDIRGGNIPTSLFTEIIQIIVIPINPSKILTKLSKYFIISKFYLF